VCLFLKAFFGLLYVGRCLKIIDNVERLLITFVISKRVRIYIKDIVLLILKKKMTASID